MKHFYSIENLGKTRNLLSLEVIVIMYQWRHGGLVWFATAMEWFLSHERRLIARDAITSTCVSRKDAIKSTKIIFSE
jgi:hypothetical protein